MAYWLLKTEPGEYSYDDLVRETKTPWNGVTNPTAQRNLRSMKPGDSALIYHTGDEKRVVGLATIVGEPYPDPTDGAGKRVLVDVAPSGQLKRSTTLSEIRTMPLFDESPLTRQARLSVVPLAPAQFQALTAGGTE
jgi:predicted RNA-binding protein with PUA-like domain